MRDYFLKTERLGFDVWAPRDSALAQRLWGNAEVTLLTGGPLGTAQANERLQLEIANQRRYGSQYWPVFLAHSGEHAGCCGLRPRDPGAGVFELGYQFHMAFWGAGLGHEAAQAVLQHAFATLGIAGLYAGHHPRNQASRRILEGLGFRYTQDEFYPPTGLMEPCYALWKEEWDPAGQRPGQ